MSPHSMEKFGQEVRRLSDDLAKPDETISRAKHRALSDWQNKKKSSRHPFVMFAMAAAVVTILVFSLLPLRASAITYSVGSSNATAAVGTWIAAESEATLVRFSEGTQISLESGARARVTHADSNGATMLVERGKAHANVVHTSASTSWLVHAGPFDIHVVGTEFDVEWDPAREVLNLHVSEGKVVVKGPLLDAGRAISANEVLRVDVRGKTSEMRVDGSLADETENGLSRQSTSRPPSDSMETDKVAIAAAPIPSAKQHPQPSWQELAAAGRHREAMQAVERAGFDHIIATSSANVLLELADEARYAGEHARARQALLRARELGERGRTAFLLGKIAADHEHSEANAVTWLERYLEESPNGSLAEQALGRIIEIEDRRGNHVRAQKAAQTYLQRHPGGAYETLARRVVEP